MIRLVILKRAKLYSSYDNLVIWTGIKIAYNYANIDKWRWKELKVNNIGDQSNVHRKSNIIIQLNKALF